MSAARVSRSMEAASRQWALAARKWVCRKKSVQEFQIATVNFDLSTGMTDAGAINVVTRAEVTSLRPPPSIFSATTTWPAIQPSSGSDDPDPFFRAAAVRLRCRRPHPPQPRFLLWQLGAQRSARGCGHDSAGADFAHLSRITASPLSGDLFSVRSTRDSLMRTPCSSALSRWQPAVGPAAAITVVRRTHILRTGTASRAGQIRVSSRLRACSARRWSTIFGFPSSASDRHRMRLARGLCAMPRTWRAGDQHSTGRSGAWQFDCDRQSWTGGSISMTPSPGSGARIACVRVNWEHNRERNLIWNNEPVAITLFSPDRVRAFNSQPGVSAAQRIPLPAAFRTIDDDPPTASPEHHRRDRRRGRASGERKVISKLEHGVAVRGGCMAGT